MMNIFKNKKRSTEASFVAKKRFQHLLPTEKKKQVIKLLQGRRFEALILNENIIKRHNTRACVK